MLDNLMYIWYIKLSGVRNEWRLVPLVFDTSPKGRLKNKEAAIEFV